MGLMQSGSNFTDRIVKNVAKWAERKTKPASPSRGHVILYIDNLKESFVCLRGPNVHVYCFKSAKRECKRLREWIHLIVPSVIAMIDSNNCPGRNDLSDKTDVKNRPVH